MKRSLGLLLAAGAMLCAPLLARAQMGPGAGGFGGSAGGQSKPKGAEGDILPEVDEKIANDPQAVFARAEKAYKDHDWLEAIAYYQHLRTKFSYNVTLGALAELRLGDVAYAREHWPEARSYYRNFLKLHPRHEKADYAAYQLGLCAYKDIPTSFFIEPPVSERDQTEVHTALQTMQDFVRDYPQSDRVPEARKMILTCEEKLADNEIYVAHFYAGRKKWAGVALRGEGLARMYPESRHVPEALVMAIDARVRQSQIEEAKKDFDRLVAAKPEESWVSKGRSALRKYL